MEITDSGQVRTCLKELLQTNQSEEH
jgi:hypothetical protein